jgi:hypothetical protein
MSLDMLVQEVAAKGSIEREGKHMEVYQRSKAKKKSRYSSPSHSYFLLHLYNAL